jgi:hypothetical protein
VHGQVAVSVACDALRGCVGLFEDGKWSPIVEMVGLIMCTNIIGSCETKFSFLVRLEWKFVKLSAHPSRI